MPQEGSYTGYSADAGFCRPRQRRRTTADGVRRVPAGNRTSLLSSGIGGGIVGLVTPEIGRVGFAGDPIYWLQPQILGARLPPVVRTAMRGTASLHSMPFSAMMLVLMSKETNMGVELNEAAGVVELSGQVALLHLRLCLEPPLAYRLDGRHRVPVEESIACRK